MRVMAEHAWQGSECPKIAPSVESRPAATRYKLYCKLLPPPRGSSNVLCLPCILLISRRRPSPLLILQGVLASARSVTINLRKAWGHSSEAPAGLAEPLALFVLPVPPSDLSPTCCRRRGKTGRNFTLCRRHLLGEP